MSYPPSKTPSLGNHRATAVGLLALIVGSLGAIAPAQAQSPEAKGLAIARSADRRDLGFQDTQVDMLMVLKNRHGQESRRKIRNRTLEQKDDGDKSLIIFDSPRDIQGTAFLSFTHKSGPDDQWLYLPALKRVKRIASNNKSGPFMGSEFAYEDIASQEVEKYTYKYLRDEACDALTCFVVERYPVDKKFRLYPPGGVDGSSRISRAKSRVL